MAIGDPFGVTYEGALKGKSALGEGILGMANLILQSQMLKRQEQLQKEKEIREYNQQLGLEREKAKLGLGLAREKAKLKAELLKPLVNLFTKQLTPPATTKQEVLERIKIRGDNPIDYRIKEQTRIIQGIPVTTYVEEEIPKRPLLSIQDEAITGTIRTLSNLRQLKKLREDYGVQTGPLTIHGWIPFGQRLARGGQLGATQADINFDMIMRSMQANYAHAETGANRGFPELQWLTIALPGGEMPSENFDAAVNSSTKVLEERLYEMLSHAKKSRREIGEYESLLPSLKQKMITIEEAKAERERRRKK